MHVFGPILLAQIATRETRTELPLGAHGTGTERDDRTFTESSRCANVDLYP
jgi:hypothetical protein